MSDVQPPDGGDAKSTSVRLASSRSRSRRRWNAPSSTTRCRSSLPRALPDVRDGLKPVHRRILWGMYDLRAMPDRPTLKCARVTGEVMGKYHPHGDGAIYDALVRMGQAFSLRHPLVQSKGNFGSLDDPPAASRYTECRLTPIALQMMEGIGEDTVDFIDNYSGEFEVPDVLPSRFPNLLVNGSQGIAVGMATNIPPHNLGEVIDAVTHLIDNPEATPEDLMQFVTGPDFPTGGQIMGRQGILDAYTTGRGSIRLRGTAEIEEGARQDQIVITALPYQASPSALLAKVSDLVKSGELTGIAEANDESAQGDDAHRPEAQARRRRARHPEQPLQAHTAADELRGEHGRARRRCAAHAEPARRRSLPTSTIRSKSSRGAPSSASGSAKSARTSSRVC